MPGADRTVMSSFPMQFYIETSQDGGASCAQYAMNDLGNTHIYVF